jgi:hypothetical protein
VVKEKRKSEVNEPIKTVKIGGLRSAMNARKSEKDKNDDNSIRSLSAAEQDKLASINKEKAEELFKKYAETLIAEKRGSLAAFFADPLLTVADDTITITVGSKIVENQIIEEKNKLVRHFATSGSKLVDVTCIVNAAEISEYKIFSPKEQFTVMAKEFPALADFASRFSLDFE